MTDNTLLIVIISSMAFQTLVQLVTFFTVIGCEYKIFKMTKTFFWISFIPYLPLIYMYLSLPKDNKHIKNIIKDHKKSIEFTEEQINYLEELIPENACTLGDSILRKLNKIKRKG